MCGDEFLLSDVLWKIGGGNALAFLIVAHLYVVEFLCGSTYLRSLAQTKKSKNKASGPPQ